VSASRRIAAESAARRRRAALRRDRDAGPAFFIAPVGAAPVEGGLAGIDLLHAEPRPWPDLRGTADLVRYAFEGGDFAGVFEAVVPALPLAPTTFAPESFASQLFLDTLIAQCMPIDIGGERHEPSRASLRRVLEAPPADAAHVAARQAALRQLVERPALRSDLERLYVALRALRATLEATPGAEPSVVRRKIAVLVALRRCVGALAEGFEDARGVLARLRAYGERVRARSAWTRLEQLVDLEGHLATVDVRLRLGADGTVRDFGVLAVRENRGNALVAGPWRRFWQRVAAFFRGYRYGESEVVARLLEEVFAPLTDVVVELLATTPAVEVYLAALGFRDAAARRGLAVSLPELVEPAAAGDAERVYEGLFDPLLFAQGITPRPCDLPAPRPDGLVVVTGPNSGGKTRLLEAIALTQLLGQVGLFVPAARARLVRAPRLFLSLVVEADAAQVEGRLGTELLRVRALFEQLEPGAMALLDELCSGTNPSEGEAIFELVVSLLPALRPQLFVTTHFLGLAQRLAAAPPVESLAFLQVDLDAEERPTYRFVPGVATTSLAHQVAARLGVTRADLEALVAARLRPR
jgi:DNA mismatch repair protein MutS2